ncbi:MAG: hypothetical protein BWX95_02732 [Bacteroidetes bacterium ADurb.Bin141]|nr:MAG: hypothetical protein BWX95_02732 [Bacteroidetes bacterium ADurb.Bin141]
MYVAACLRTHLILTKGLSYFLQVNTITSTRKCRLNFVKKLYATLKILLNQYRQIIVKRINLINIKWRQKIMPSDFIKNLIGKGYFPQEITPWFKTDKLTPIIDTIISNISNFPQKTSKPCRYSMPKGKHSRRLLSVPNPLHQIKLCKVIGDDWGFLRNLISDSKMSLTIPSVKARSLRALSRKFSFSDISEKIINSSTSSRYLLRTDISRYYSTQVLCT